MKMAYTLTNRARWGLGGLAVLILLPAAALASGSPWTRYTVSGGSGRSASHDSSSSASAWTEKPSSVTTSARTRT